MASLARGNPAGLAADSEGGAAAPEVKLAAE
jgi:hypothetical protein